MNRRERRQHRIQLKWRKFLASVLFIILVFGSIHVTFADEDIGLLLSNWFDRKTTDSIDMIDASITTEQQKQATRLKEELRLEVERAEQQLDAIAIAEKEKRIAELERYADTLLTDLTMEQTELENTIVLELERILNDAKSQMDNLQTNSLMNED